MLGWPCDCTEKRRVTGEEFGEVRFNERQRIKVHLYHTSSLVGLSYPRLILPSSQNAR